MELIVVKINQKNLSCSAQSSNDILVVFTYPESLLISLGDKLQVVDLKMDSNNKFIHQASNLEFQVMIKSNDVHDLRLPAEHGGSRTPTNERIFSK